MTSEQQDGATVGSGTALGRPPGRLADIGPFHCPSPSEHSRTATSHRPVNEPFADDLDCLEESHTGAFLAVPRKLANDGQQFGSM